MDGGIITSQLFVSARPRFITDFVTSIDVGATSSAMMMKAAFPLLPGDTGVTFTFGGGGFAFNPPSITFAPGMLEIPFSMRYSPSSTTVLLANAAQTYTVTMSGPDAWKYVPLESSVYSVAVVLREVSVFMDHSTVTIGASYSGYLSLPTPTATDLTVTFVSDAVTFSPASVTFTATGGHTRTFSYVINSDISQTDFSANREVNFELSGSDASHYAPMEAFMLSASKREVLWDKTFDDFALFKSHEQAIFMVNRPSHLYSLSLTTAPNSDLTVTFESEYLRFEPASLGFSPGVLTQSFSFTPTMIPATQQYNSSDDMTSVIAGVNVVLGGADAALFDVAALSAAFSSGMLIIPELDVSPAPAIYTDGESEPDMVVVLKDGAANSLTNGLPDSMGGAYNGFKLHVSARTTDGDLLPNVYVEPSVLEFSSATSQALRSFHIRHTHSTVLSGLDSYDLRYELRFAGESLASAVDISSYMPQHARTVMLKRYNIVPEFPKLLSYWWQYASFNLTRANQGHVALTPYMPPLDGQSPEPIYAGHATATGRVVFDPPVITFSPGQLVATFLVKAARGFESESGYYRVDWKLHGHSDDTANFLEGPRGFSTYHMASGAALGFSLMALLLFVLPVLLL